MDEATIGYTDSLGAEFIELHNTDVETDAITEPIAAVNGSDADMESNNDSNENARESSCMPHGSVVEENVPGTVKEHGNSSIPVATAKPTADMHDWKRQMAKLDVIDVTCNNNIGKLHVSHFGSGSKGKCIKCEEKWYTPNEFETFCGRANTKDWKRSLRCQGHLLMHLVNASILKPHAASCSCKVCCGDQSVSGPVRLHRRIPRRKKPDKRPSHLTKKKTSDSKKVESVTNVVLNQQQVKSPPYTLFLLPSQPGQVISNVHNNDVRNSSMNIASTSCSASATEVLPPLLSNPQSHLVHIVDVPNCKGNSQKTVTPPSKVIGTTNVQDKCGKLWNTMEQSIDSLITMAVANLNHAQQLKQIFHETKTEIETYKRTCIEDLQQTYEYEMHVLLDRLKAYESTSNSGGELTEELNVDVEKI